jgi:hypothetical protein
MRKAMLAIVVAAGVGLGFGQSASAGGWDEGEAERGVIHVPTTVYVPAPRHKRCGRHFRPGCHVHPFVVYSYAGTGYPRYHYRWRGYGWNR